MANASANAHTRGMKWTGLFMLGYAILVGGVVAALWKTGVLASIGGFWTGVGITMAVGVGIMIAVGRSGAKEQIQISR
jgi:hypothetical protein